MLKHRALAAVCGLSLVLAGCGSGSSRGAPDSDLVGSNEQHRIKVNQIGFSTSGQKLAVVPDVDATDFTVVDVATGATVFSGALGEPGRWGPAGETVKLADFSGLVEVGEYRIRVEGAADSAVFRVAVKPYSSLNAAAIRALYFNRASIDLLPEHAGAWARPAGHLDTHVLVHASAASAERPENTVVSSPQGWYDAGDFGKYIVNSGISTYTLLAALEHFPEQYQNQNLNVPESGDAVPDLLDETLWNLEWMLTMQDPHDGGVYHKLTTKQFAGAVMPGDANAQRYVMQKGTAAALNFAAVMAAASRVLVDYEEQFPGKSTRMLDAANQAWLWAQANPDVAYKQPSDVGTGAYGDGNFADEFAWAAAELYITTGDDRFYEALDPHNTFNDVPSWSQSLGLAWMSLAHHRGSLTPRADLALINNRVISLADAILKVGDDSPYRVSMQESDFVWGSNGVAMNRAMMLLQAYRVTQNNDYLNAAQSLLDYVLGRNPTDYSYVTGFGERSPMYIHHRQSEADNVEAPVPGFLAGGPRGQQGEDCKKYPSTYPAKSYLDDWCSYSTNEVTINWNAPLVYVSGALEAVYSD
jgi:endoglucanase